MRGLLFAALLAGLPSAASAQEVKSVRAGTAELSRVMMSDRRPMAFQVLKI